MRVPRWRTGFQARPIGRGTPAVIIALLVFLMGGCSFLSKKPNNYFTLAKVAPAAPVGAVSGAPFALTGVELPAGFDRKEIVVREENHGVEVRARDLWTANLEPMVLSTLAFDLADRLPPGMMILPGQTQGAGTSRVIDVVFEEFAAGPDESVILDARWTSGTTTRREQIAVPLPSISSADIAAAMSQALGQLADRIAAGL